MPSDCSAEGAGDETNGEGRERGESGSRPAQFRKEQGPKKNRRSGRKDKEVEILNGLRENCDDNHPSLGASAFVAEVQFTVTRVVVRRRVRNVSHLVSGGYVSATVSD